MTFQYPYLLLLAPLALLHGLTPEGEQLLFACERLLILLAIYLGKPVGLLGPLAAVVIYVCYWDETDRLSRHRVYRHAACVVPVFTLGMIALSEMMPGFVILVILWLVASVMFFSGVVWAFQSPRNVEKWGHWFLTVAMTVTTACLIRFVDDWFAQDYAVPFCASAATCFGLSTCLFGRGTASPIPQSSSPSPDPSPSSVSIASEQESGEDADEDEDEPAGSSTETSNNQAAAELSQVVSDQVN